MKADAGIGQRRSIFNRVFYGWYIVAAGMGIHLWVSIAWIYGMQVFFAPIVQTFGWSRAVISGAFSLQRLEGSIITPIEGFLLDRFGPRKMILVGVTMSGAGMILMSFLQSIWMFYAAVLLISLGNSASSGIPRNWAIVHWFRRLRGRVLGIGATGAVISGPLLIIVVWLVENLGWRMAFVVLGVATWCICIPLGLVFRSRPEEYGYLPDGDLPDEDSEGKSPTEASPVVHGRGAPTDSGLTIAQALRTRTFWIVAVIFGAQSMGVSAMMVHMIPYFESRGFSSTQAASVLGLYTLLSVFGRLGGGWIMDFVDRRVVLAGLLACQAFAFLILANTTTYWMVFPFALLYGTAFGGMIPSRGMIISTYFGTESFGAMDGLTQSVAVLGGMVGPVLMGWVFDATQSYVLAIYFLAGVAALAVPLTFLARAPRPGVAKEAG